LTCIDVTLQKNFSEDRKMSITSRDIEDWLEKGAKAANTTKGHRRRASAKLQAQRHLDEFAKEHVDPGAGWKVNSGDGTDVPLGTEI